MSGLKMRTRTVQQVDYFDLESFVKKITGREWRLRCGRGVPQRHGPLVLHHGRGAGRVRPDRHRGLAGRYRPECLPVRPADAGLARARSAHPAGRLPRAGQLVSGKRGEPIAALPLAEGYAQHMEGWTAEPFSVGGEVFDHGAYLVGPDGVRLFVRVDAHDKRAIISVSHQLDGVRISTDAVDRPTISVGLDRDPAAAARDILRRLVPESKEAHARVQARIAAEMERVARVEQIVSDTVEEFACLRLSSAEGELRYSPDDNGYGTVRISYGGGGGAIDLSLSIEQIKRVLRALTEQEDQW